jgi:N-acetylglutamate synthase-like GNAT family acetyltransferase
MRACRSELTLTPESITSSNVKVAEINERLVGMAQLEVHERVAELAKLFVEPDVLRSGAGRALFMWAKTAARQFGAAVLIIDADPDAADFYRRLGATGDSLVPSGSLPGRVIPRLRVTL